MSSSRRPWPWFGLAVAVLLAGVGAGANLGGWWDTPTVTGPPRPAFTPPPPVIPDGAREAAALVVPAWTAVAGAAAGTSGPEAERYQRLADTLALHWRVLNGPDPLARTDPAATPGPDSPTDPASPSTPVTPGPVSPADPETALADARSALATLSHQEWANATASGGVTAAWWAGLAGATDQVSAGLDGVYQAPAPLRWLVTVATSDDAHAVDALLAAYHEAVFTTATVLGRISKGPAYDGLAATLDRLKQQRDGLQRWAEDAGWTVQPPAAVYFVPSMTDDASGWTLVDQSLRAAAQAAMAWLASTTDQAERARAELQALIGLGHGYAPDLWFGWPD